MTYYRKDSYPQSFDSMKNALVDLTFFENKTQDCNKPCDEEGFMGNIFE